jgi:mannose-1-phosphate guanylyltransferase/mannose-6-phosphate isomerase
VTAPLFPVILSGGFGGRLWPVSRTHYPKQFIPLVTEHSLLQETALRLAGLDNQEAPIFICNERHRFIVAEQLHSLQTHPGRIFLEPTGKNTAPAAAISAWAIADAEPEGIMLVMPSDHVILDAAAFHNAVRDGSELARQGHLVTFGIAPTAPKTGYGYIQQGEVLDEQKNAFLVVSFKEKPDAPTAERYLASGRYQWNSGIFMFKAGVFLEQLKKLSPDIYEATRKIYHSARCEADFTWLDQDEFEKCPSDSIDYAIMEKTDRAVVISVDMGWSDVGTWGSLWEVLSKDARGNATTGQVYLKDVSNCYIKSKREIVAALGIDDLIVIDTEDALLIAHRHKEQEVRDVFKQLM